MSLNLLPIRLVSERGFKMNKSKLLRKIYNEFSLELKTQYSQSELLLAANKFLHILKGTDPIKGAATIEERIRFDERDVYDLMENFSWQVLNSESVLMKQSYTDDTQLDSANDYSEELRNFGMDLGMDLAA